MHVTFWGGRLRLQSTCQMCLATLSWFPTCSPSGEKGKFCQNFSYDWTLAHVVCPGMCQRIVCHAQQNWMRVIGGIHCSHNHICCAVIDDHSQVREHIDWYEITVSVVFGVQQRTFYNRVRKFQPPYKLQANWITTCQVYLGRHLHMMLPTVFS